MLTECQSNNLYQLKEEAKKNNEFAIIGTKNSGRRYVIDYWSKEIYPSIIIELKATNLNYPCASLIVALKEKLRELFQFKKKKIRLKANISFVYQIIELELSKVDDDLFKAEETIEKCLKRIIKKYSIIFVLDNTLNINDGSIKFINTFFEKHSDKYKKRNALFKIVLSETIINNISNVFFKNISHDSIDSVLDNLGLNPQIRLSSKVKQFIFANISNNIGLLVDIVNDFNNNNLDYNLEKYDINDKTNIILSESINKYKYANQLNDLLTICSISQHYFKTIDLAYILKENEEIINLYLQFATKHFLLEKNSSGYQIIFGLVKKVYESLDEIKKRRLYNNILLMFANIYPSDYYNKYLFSNLAGNKSCNIYLMQHIFKEIRLKHDINLDDYESILSKDEYKIVETYNTAFGYVNLRRYSDCSKLLNSLNSLSGAILYEINILKSQCCIKEIDEIIRKKSLDYLDFSTTDSHIDENLKYRLNIRKIAAFIHVGNYNKAIKTCDIMKNHLLEKLSETKALEYEYYLNVIYRKYSYVSEYDLSINEVKKSVNFFRTHKKMYYKGFYIALTNLLSLYIINMQMSKAKVVKDEIENLKIEKNNIKFPRPEILKNNIILYNYFADYKGKKEIETDFKELYSKTSGLADNILIASNYAVFMMFNDKLYDAKNILVKQIDNIQQDHEGVYKYRILLNLAICEFLIDNTKRNESLKLLEKVKYNKQDPHFKVRNAELKNIIELMKTIDGCNNASEWCELYKSRMTTIINTHTTYQQGLVFTTLFDWDDD